MKAGQKKNGTQVARPAWHHQVARQSTALFYPERGVLIDDADPYDAVLRTNAGRLSEYAGALMAKEERVFFSPVLLREAALLLDLLHERQRARDDAAEARKPSRKAERS